MPDADQEMIALRHSIERLTAEIERLTGVLRAVSPATESDSRAQMRQMIDRPEVDQEDRNTPPDVPDDEGDDAARV